MSRKANKAITAGRILALVKAAERASDTGATGQTIIKQQPSPVDRLASDKRIGPVELMAATEIYAAYRAITVGLWLTQGWPQERVSGSAGRVTAPVGEIEPMTRYRAWADHWSMLAKRGDKTLAIVIDAVVDEWPLYTIEDRHGCRHGIARKAVIRGLRDYAARAGWVDATTRAQWLAEAGNTFSTPDRTLALAIAAAKR